MTTSHPVELVDSCGTAIPSEVDVSEDGDEYVVQFRWAGQAVSATGEDAFSALCTARMKLAALGLMPRCYGACRNLVVSGMAVQMGGGLKGYLVRLGQQARMSGLVDIFAAGPDMDLVTVTEQQEFKLAWLRSLGLAV